MSAARAGGAFLLVWLPYIASTFLAERMSDGGLLSQSLMLLAFVMMWPASRMARSGFGLALGKRTLLLFFSFLAIGLILAAVRWKLATAIGAATPSRADMPGVAAALSGVAIALVPTLTEDVLTRGFPMFAWNRRNGTIALVLLSAGLYTLNHLWRLDWGWTEQVRLFAMGLAYAAAVVATGSLWSAVGLHLAGNVAPILMTSIAASAVDVEADRLTSAGVHLVAAGLLGALAWYRMRQSHNGEIITGARNATCDRD